MTVRTNVALAQLRALCPVVLVVASLASGGQAHASPARWTADSDRSRITLHAFKRGLLSGVAHDHHFVAGEWRATATFDEGGAADARVEVVVAADSLRDQQPALSQRDRAKVDRQAASPDVLDARRYPTIRFMSKRLDVAPGAPRHGEVRGTLLGTLSLHGRDRPVSVPITASREGDAWRARGVVTFKQSDFGIHPYSAFLGTIAVRDEVKLEYDLVLRAAPGEYSRLGI